MHPVNNPEADNELISLLLSHGLFTFLGFNVFHHAAFFAHLALSKFINLSFERIFTFNKFKADRGTDYFKCITEVIGKVTLV